MSLAQSWADWYPREGLWAMEGDQPCLGGGAPQLGVEGDPGFQSARLQQSPWVFAHLFVAVVGLDGLRSHGDTALAPSGQCCVSVHHAPVLPDSTWVSEKECNPEPLGGGGQTERACGGRVIQSR